MPDAATVRGYVDALRVSLECWALREEKPDAHSRQCANDAMDAVDAALAELHKIRAALITETRAADDATAARVDKLLAERKGLPGA